MSDDATPQDESDQPAGDRASEEVAGISWVDFLTSTPPGILKLVYDLGQYRPTPGHPAGGRRFVQRWLVNISTIQLFCESDQCDGERYFGITLDKMGTLGPETDEIGFLTYQCRNCGRSRKQYALGLKMNAEPNEDNDEYSGGVALKFGEWLPFGLRIPRRVRDLIKNKDDLELFRQGLKAEGNGLGIGAFSYYRRVVENEKSRLFQRIIDVAMRTDSSKEVVDILEAANEEKQFTRAVEMVKDGIPDVLRIDGHNPLTSLHQALSTGIHDKTDAECLELAKTVRLVLTELADRAAAALKEHKELTQALAKLHKAKD